MRADQCDNPGPHHTHEWYDKPATLRLTCPGVPLAVQTRCPRCLGEQYVLNVMAFSEGKTVCTVCGQKTHPLSDAQWRDALRQTRRNPDLASIKRLKDLR